MIIVPGRTAETEKERILKYIEDNDAVVISVNFLHNDVHSDYVYMSNWKRYNYWLYDSRFATQKKIITSNIMQTSESDDDIIVSFNQLVKCGWEHIDNSTIMLLRLLDKFRLRSLSIAGFDGYKSDGKGSLNYADSDLELSDVRDDPTSLNNEISEMLSDFAKTREQRYNISFITSSRFEKSI